MILNHLLLAGATRSVSLVDTDGRSALHSACAYNQHNAVDILLRHNASVTLVCNNGLSPVDVVGVQVLAYRQRGRRPGQPGLLRAVQHYEHVPEQARYDLNRRRPFTLNSAETSTVDAICDMLQPFIAWSRRGWLVMMRSLPLAEVVEQPDHSHADALTFSIRAMRLVHEPSRNTAGFREEEGIVRTFHDGGRARTNWGAAVVWLLRCPAESLFRHVVRFL